MKNTARYFDATGNEVDAAHAFDQHGVLKDRCTMRVPTTLRDSMRARDAKPQFTDGSNIVDSAAGLKPGWRMPVSYRPRNDSSILSRMPRSC
jgi:hypothetical protein